MKEQLTQEENNLCDIDAVVDHSLKSRNKAESLKMMMPGFGVTRSAESTFLSVFTLPAKKWGPQQGQLHEFFEGNPSPICTSSPPPSQGIDAQVNLAPQINVPMDVDAPADRVESFPHCQPPLASSLAAAAAAPFNPMAFLKEWGEKMQWMHKQQPQTIVLKLRADKSCKSKAKFNNDMLQLLLVSGKAKFTPPGTFATPRIPIYTQAMKIILAQPSTV
jgi:hypothetical protein